MADDGFDVRVELVKLLIKKVADDTYPSATMMNMIEQLIGPDEVPAYTAVLMDKIQADDYPSIPLMKRVMALR